MKFKFYLAILALSLSVLNIYGQGFKQATVGPQTEGDLSDDVSVTNNCYVDGWATVIPIEVSDVPVLSEKGYNVEGVTVQFTFSGIWSQDITLVSPSGTRVALSSSNSGSWPDLSTDPTGYKAVRIYDYLYPEHNLPFHYNGSDTKFTKSIESFDAFLGEDPNGTWILEFCGSDQCDLAYDRLSILFRTYDPYAYYDYPGLFETTKASDCSSQDGSLEFAFHDGRNNEVGSFYKIDNGHWTFRPFPPLVSGAGGGLPLTETIGGLSAGPHTFYLARALDANTIEGGSIFERKFNIEVNAGTSDLFVNCGSEFSVPLGQNGSTDIALNPPDYGDNCGFTSSISSVRVYDPSSNLVYEQSMYDEAQAPYMVTLSTLGTYSVDWTVTGEGGNTASCVQYVYVGQNENVTFPSKLCGNGPEFVEYVPDAGLIAEYFTVDVTGMSSLDGSFGIRDVYFDAYINSSTMATFNLIDPVGNVYPLFNHNSFPTFGGNDYFRAYMTSCSSIPAIGHDEDQPYQWGGAYRPITDLNTLNTSGMDPNGRWYLEVMSNDPGGLWLYCWKLDFGECGNECDNDTEAPQYSDCPQDRQVQLDANDEVVVSIACPDAVDNCTNVDYSQNLGYSHVEMNYSGGATDPFGQTYIQYEEFTPGNMQDFTIVGEGTLELKFYFFDNASNSSICSVTIIANGNSNPCDNDTEAPVFTDCPSDQAIILNEEDAGVFSVTDPGFSDNCTIVSQLHTITYKDGCTNAAGQTTEMYEFISSGTSYTYSVIGFGTVEFKYEVNDQAGNTATCISSIEVLDPSGPCVNDVEVPLFTNCTNNFHVTQGDNNQANVTVAAPTVTDNCAVADRNVVINFYGGATDKDGNTMKQYTNFDDGADGTFTVLGTGTVEFNFNATDPAGNTNSCVTVVNVVPAADNVLFVVGEECAVPGLSTVLPVKVFNFNQIGAFSFDLEISPANSGLTFDRVENSGVSNLSFNVLGNGDLRISWDDPNGNDIDLEDNFKIFDIVVSADNSFDAEATISGKDVVVLSNNGESGQVGAATICVGSGVIPSGKILSSGGKAHGGVTVNLLNNGSIIANTSTDTQGNYTLAGTDNNNRVQPYNNEGVRDGISIVDVAKIRRHFLDLVPLNSDYKKVAADVNKDGKINVLDVAYTNRVFLQKRNDFPNNTSWRFLPQNLDISANPLNVNYNDFIALDQPGLDYNNLNFVSIKTGDVDDSALLRDKVEGTQLRDDLSFSIPDTTLAPASEMRIPVYVSGNAAVSAFSMNLAYDVSLVELVSIESDQIPSFGGGNYNDIDGNVLIGWDHPNGQDFETGGTFMTLVFKNVQTTGTSTITFGETELYDVNFNVIGFTGDNGSISLSTTGVKEIGFTYDVIAQPNPFAGSTTLKVNLSSPQELTVTLTDANGKVLKTIQSVKSRLHHIAIADLEYKGVILATLQNENFTEVVKLIAL